MKTIKLLTLVFLLSNTTLSIAQVRDLTKEYTITGLAKHIVMSDKLHRVKYDFYLNNQTNKSISSLVIGQESVLSNQGIVPIETYAEQNSLLFSSPANWQVFPRDEESSSLTSFYWNIKDEVNYELYVIKPFSIENFFSITATKRLKNLLTSFAELSVSDTTWINNRPIQDIVKLTKGDTIAPTATITPRVIANTTKKRFYNINLNLQVKDNYDPLPEITFDSIQDITNNTSNSSPFSNLQYTLNRANNIVTGMYPTIITIAADAKIAKNYKINYKITDASDNQRVVSAVVTIPKQ
jgi:hypothetical protein